MKKYPETIKQAMVKRLTMPSGPSQMALAKEVGIPYQTLSRWVQEYAKIPAMETNKAKKNRSAEEKLEIVFKVLNMSESEYGEYLRKEGLLSTDIESWKADSLEAARKSNQGRPKKDAELVKWQKKTKELERDLRRKEKALAEASALLILKKKAEAIWGADEDDESD